MFLIRQMGYQLFRNKGRTILLFCIAVLLVCCMALYIGNIRSTESALENLADSIPVTARVVSRDGSRQVGLEIKESHFKKIMDADIRDPIYTVTAIGVWDEKQRTGEMIGGDTQIVGVNHLSAIVNTEKDTFEYAQGYDDTFVSEDKAVCILNEVYAKQQNVTIGTVMTLPLYAVRYNEDNMTVRYDLLGEYSIEVIGIYSHVNSTIIDSAAHVIVPVKWLENITRDSGIQMLYDSFRCMVNNPLEMNAFKQEMTKAGFREVDSFVMDWRNGDGLLVDDLLFMETSEKLSQSLKVLRWFLIPFFVLSTVIITLVTFMILRSSRKEMAIAVSLGQSKMQSALSYFLSILAADILGCVVAFFILVVVLKMAVLHILAVLAFFMICATLGIWLALILLLRFDALALLTKID